MREELITKMIGWNGQSKALLQWIKGLYLRRHEHRLKSLNHWSVGNWTGSLRRGERE